MQQYWYEDSEINKVIRSDSYEAFRRCLLIIELEIPAERYRTTYALREINYPGALGNVDTEQKYRAIWGLIERSLVAED